MSIDELNKDFENYDKELTFEMKYCARLAAYHQNSKDTVKALKVKVKELKEKIKIEEERLQKLKALKEEEKTE